MAYEDIFRHAQTVYLEEADWLNGVQREMADRINEIESDFAPEALSSAILDASLREGERYYYDAMNPFIKGELLSSTWRDLSRLYSYDHEWDASRFETSVDQIVSIVNKFILPINKHVDPVVAPTKAVITAEVSLNACENAEGYFEDALRQATTGKYLYQKKLSVYHDKSGTPVAFRKFCEESSALTLEPINLHGMILPPGTVVGVGPGTNDNDTPTQKGSSYRGKFSFATYEIGDVFQINPARLSPWAFASPLDRALFALYTREDGSHETIVKPVRLEIVQGPNLDLFRKAANQIMKQCGTLVEAKAA